jgi:hypothetical protein
MQLDKEAIDEFKTLYYREYGERLNDEQATDYAVRLIMLIKAVYGDSLPLPSSKFDNKTKKGNN